MPNQGASGTISKTTSRPSAVPDLRDLARLGRVRDRIDREYAEPPDVEALGRGACMSRLHGLINEYPRAALGEPRLHQARNGPLSS